MANALLIINDVWSKKTHNKKITHNIKKLKFVFTLKNNTLY